MMQSSNKLQVWSGFQIGADQGGVEAAKELGFPTGGMMPKGWITQDGPRPDFAELYGAIEAPVKGYPYRTFWNAQNSEATLRFAVDFTTAGEVCTLNAIKKYDKLHRNVRLQKDDNIIPSPSSVEYIANWIKENKFKVVNIAGNSNKSHPLMQIKVKNFMLEVLKRLC